jgi:hypothetical protein
MSDDNAFVLPEQSSRGQAAKPTAGDFRDF